MTANPYVTWALGPLATDARVAVIAEPGIGSPELALVAQELAAIVTAPLVEPAVADLIVLAHRGAFRLPTSHEARRWPRATRVATWRVPDRVVHVVPFALLSRERRRAQVAHALRSGTVRVRSQLRRWPR